MEVKKISHSDKYYEDNKSGSYDEVLLVKVWLH